MVEFVQEYGEETDAGSEYDKFLKLLGLKKKTLELNCDNIEEEK